MNRCRRTLLNCRVGFTGLAAVGAVASTLIPSSRVWAGTDTIASAGGGVTSANFPDAPVMNEAGQVVYRRRSSIGIIGQPLPVSIRRGDGMSTVTIASTNQNAPSGPGHFESFSTSEGT